jgi:Fur family transcriptional regulator, zinc uptake regulator
MSSCDCHNHTTCKTTAMKKAEAYCTAHNLRLTDTRREVLGIIWQSHKALTANDIMEALGNNQPPITYRALQFLQENGLIHHIASINAYIGCPHIGETHTGQMVICKHCRTVTEINTPLPQLMADASRNGFAVEETHIEILGTCQHCQPHV